MDRVQVGDYVGKQQGTGVRQGKVTEDKGETVVFQTLKGMEVEHKKDELVVDPGRSERSMSEEEFRRAKEQWQRLMPSADHDAGGNPRPNRATAEDRHAPNY
ncbi:hypothetical protein DUNSADRAFT_4206 [Dunaliella salina]|uniref:Hypervirulence associated protein TUDOR domain-containing protein n=1 Tax=Dunaliella salina TaxID=3046 RepID=A0ABQ7GSP7_DUNSA|nr:hypothetical protein DUNSADRAFT_4206 [Dunaliella salina]|eukprot:KAF5837570.1 hypothetical protein DUNSADRAFT_4206 [Dunaliella salina]